MKNMNIINNIIRITKSKGITIYQLEKDGIINQTTFSSWKRGCQPALDKIIKIMRYLEISPNELFGYNETPKLSETETELFILFNQLPENEKYKLIGRLEAQLDNLKQKEKSNQECN